MSDLNIDINKLKAIFAEADQHSDNDADKKDNVFLNSAFEEQYVSKKLEAEGLKKDEIDTIFAQVKGNTANKSLEEIFGFTSEKTVDPARSFSDAAITAYNENKPKEPVIPKDNEARAARFIATGLDEFKDFNQVKGNIDAKLSDSSISETEKNFYHQAQDVVTRLTASNVNYDTKENIKALYDTVKKEIKDADLPKEDKKYQLAVLEALIGLAERKVFDKEFKDIEDTYKKFRNDGKNIDDAYKATKEAFKGKKSYTDEALKKLKKETMINDAHALREEYRRKQEGTEADFALGRDSKYYDSSSRDVKTGIKRDMKKDGVYSKTVRKIARRNGMSTSELVDPYAMSIEKGQDKRAAVYNRVETRKHIAYTQKEIEDVLSDKTLFSGLVQPNTKAGNPLPLISQNVDNKGNITYNISELSDFINQYLSPKEAGDGRANVNQDREREEISNVAKALSMRTGMTVSRADAKHLIDFCGFDRDKKNALYDIPIGMAKGVANFILPGASEAVAFAAESTIDLMQKADFTGKKFTVDLNKYIKPQVINIELDISQYVNLNGNPLETDFELTPSSSRKLEAALEVLRNKGYDADWNYKDDGSGIVLWIKGTRDNMGSIDVDLKEALGEEYTLEDLGAKDSDPKTNRATALAVGIGTAAAMGAIAELMKPYKSEMSIINTYVAKDVSYNDFIEMLATLKLPEQAKQLFKYIALQHVEKDGNGKINFQDKDGNPLICDENGHVLDAEGNPTEVEGIAAWNRLGLIDQLNEIAGLGSNLNKHEAYGASTKPLQYKLIMQNNVDKKVGPEPDNIAPGVESEPQAEPVKPLFKKEIVDQTEPVERFYGANMFSSWDPLIELYPNLANQQGMTRPKAARMLKVMQAITDGNYDFDRLKRLTDLSYSNRNALKEEKGFDYTTFASVLEANIAGDKTDTKPNGNKPNGREWWSILAPKEITRNGETFIAKVEIPVPDPKGGGRGTAITSGPFSSTKTTHGENYYRSDDNGKTWRQIEKKDYQGD